MYLKNRASISKYLRHSETVSSKHYNFRAVEESDRNRVAVVSLMGSDEIEEIDTESNSTIEPDDQMMTDAERADKVFKHLIQSAWRTISHE